jgi:hypothetical protein
MGCRRFIAGPFRYSTLFQRQFHLVQSGLDGFAVFLLAFLRRNQPLDKQIEASVFFSQGVQFGSLIGLVGDAVIQLPISLI